MSFPLKGKYLCLTNCFQNLRGIKFINRNRVGRACGHQRRVPSVQRAAAPGRASVSASVSVLLSWEILTSSESSLEIFRSPVLFPPYQNRYRYRVAGLVSVEETLRRRESFFSSPGSDVSPYACLARRESSPCDADTGPPGFWVPVSLTLPCGCRPERAAVPPVE